MLINCVPLTGLTYKIDAKEAHKGIHEFVQVETAKTWINPKENKQDGQLDYPALLAHYGVEGNKTLRIKEAEELRTLVIHRNKKAMSFEKFLTNMKTIVTGFSKNGDILNESQKIRLLLHKVQNLILTQIKASLQVYYDLDQSNKVTYDFIANRLSEDAARLGYPSPPRSWGRQHSWREIDRE